jgi:hypothetical protein
MLCLVGIRFTGAWKVENRKEIYGVEMRNFILSPDKKP